MNLSDFLEQQEQQETPLMRFVFVFTHHSGDGVFGHGHVTVELANQATADALLARVEAQLEEFNDGQDSTVSVRMLDVSQPSSVDSLIQHVQEVIGEGELETTLDHHH